MSPEEKEVNLSVINELLDFADLVADALNKVLCEKLGESAEWGDFAGVSNAPSQFLQGKEDQDQIKNLWTLREQANSLCNWNDEKDLRTWVEANLKAG